MERSATLGRRSPQNPQPRRGGTNRNQAYLGEMTWRFDNRSYPDLFRDTLMKLVEAPVLEYRRLTAA